MESPDPDCAECGGDGIDADPYQQFDYECRKPCSDCWTTNEELT